jgi:hypothetical protein
VHALREERLVDRLLDRGAVVGLQLAERGGVGSSLAALSSDATAMSTATTPATSSIVMSAASASSKSSGSRSSRATRSARTRATLRALPATWAGRRIMRPELSRPRWIDCRIQSVAYVENR